MIARVPWRTVSLVAVNIGLLVTTILLWRHGEQRIQEPVHLAIPTLPPPDLAFLQSAGPPAVDVAGIREAAVFHARRTFYQPPPPSQALPPPDYQLAGVMGLSKDKRVAFLKKNADHSSRTIHLGDDVDGWRVEGIELARVTFIHDTQHAEIHSNTPISPGLIRGPVGPRVVSTGPRTLGGSGASGVSFNTTPSAEARIYRPPPP
jgi:hypothetical protein